MGTFNIIGLTGGIGSGKSSAARFWHREFAVACLNADFVVHELLEPQKSCWQVIYDLDISFVRHDKTIDKVRLRKKLFDDHIFREKVNDKMHPLVQTEIVKKIREISIKEGQGFFLVEVPLLFEANWQEMFSSIITVYATEEKCVKRVMQRDGVSAEQAKKTIASQWPLIEKAMGSQHVVDNSGSWGDTVWQLLHLGNLLWSKKKTLIQKNLDTNEEIQHILLNQ